MDCLINKKDKIFIAGHLGMVGSAIHNLLKVKGYENILVASRKDLDLRTFSEVEKWFQSNKPDVVIIAAAKVGGIMANFKYPAEFILDNLKIQTNIIEIAYKFQVKKLLFLGSSCIYPKFAEQPIKEESLLSGFLEPTNEFYALAKITGIKLCNALRKQYGFDAISLMPTNLYGPGDNYSLENGHVIPALIKKFHLAKISKKSVLCWGSGNPMREFLHVNDLANAILFVLENIQIKNNDIFLDSNGESLSFLNVGSGEEISIKELAKKISSVVDFRGDILWDKSKPDGTPRKLLDISRIQKLGWKSKINLEDGLKVTYDDFKKNFT